MRDYDNICLGGQNGQMPSGRFKFHETGIGWKNLNSGDIITVSAADIKQFHWTRVCKEYQLKIVKSNSQIILFQGFPKDSFDDISSTVKSHYQLPLEIRDSCLKGWNWGQVEFTGSNMTFSVSQKPTFHVPLTEVANVAMTAKNEAMIEFAPPKLIDPLVKPKEDVLVEMKFYIPGLATAGKVSESDGNTRFKDTTELANELSATNTDGSAKEAGEIDLDDEQVVVGDDGEALSAAAVFIETVKQKSNVDLIQSEHIVKFGELLCLTPRSRFELQLHQDFLRLRGKSHDYKILYSSITRLFLLPKSDDTHWMFVIGLNPPIRQGQTRYPYLIFQMEKDEEIEVDINLSDEELEEQYKGKLSKSYDGPIYEVVSDVLSILATRKITSAGSFKSGLGHSGIKCSQKANEVILYPLERSFLAIPKPTIQIAHSEITAVTFSRVGSSNLRTFEMKISTSSGTDTSFSSIPREEYESLETYCLSKKILVRSEMAEEGQAGNYDEADSDDAGTLKRSADQMDMDSESDDEDFAADSASDVAEEFDEQYSSSDEDGDNEKSNTAGSSKDSRAIGESSSKLSKNNESSDEEPSSPVKKSSKSKSSEDKEKPKKKVKKDPNAPKRPLTSFLLFSNEKRSSIVAKDPSLGIGDKYDDLAAVSKEKYLVQMKEYNEKGGRELFESADAKAKSVVKKSAPAKKSTTEATSPSKSKKPTVFKSEELLDSDD